MTWWYRGLQTGTPTTRYPARVAIPPGATPGLPATTSAAHSAEIAVVCPTGALAAQADVVEVLPERCIHCMRCLHGPRPMNWRHDVDWGRLAPGHEPLPRAFTRSLHVRVIDVGDCGACLAEVGRLNNPYYNFHRLGFFFTPTPRHADILLVVGTPTEQMRTPLLKTFAAMPAPRRVVAVGACALDGDLFGPGVADVLDVDVTVPGNPPPPLAILHGLLVAAGRQEAL